ncbi:hypothetical protein SO802_019994 [Lithocarpus litseifolius]|uniref:Uncharacterized protein n=1 Tax=Lithocarpus litseifolius TaxID=425828 RepID=A0AAW2CCA6_9ROSI
MNSEVKRGLLLGLLLLTALSLTWSLFFTDENMKKLTEARDGKELSRVVFINQINSQPLPWDDVSFSLKIFSNSWELAGEEDDVDGGVVEFGEVVRKEEEEEKEW